MSDYRQQRRLDKAAAAEERRKDLAAQAEQRRKDAEHAEAQRTERAQARRARFAAWRDWVAAHPVELLLSLIVLVPGLLAVPAMAAFGVQVYGSGIGWLLPAFSEAGMWAFAFATHAARREGRPTGWLQVGVWVFTGVSAGLNFAHGDLIGGFATGFVMALVAIGGVVAHQLITAAPMRTRRTRAEKRAARTARLAARRVARMERAAVDQAVGELDASGSVQLRFAPGVVTLAHGRFGIGRRLVPATVPGLPVNRAEDELDVELRALLDQAGEPAGTAQMASESPGSGTSEHGPEIAEHVAEIRRAIAAGELPPKPSRRKVQQHLGIRALTAQTVLKALRGHDDGGGSAGMAV
jgi:hypothetical protein